MAKIAIATDSNSGITQSQGKELGIFVLPMPFYINDELFLEDVTLTQAEFYARLERELREEINSLGIGPQGLGGRTTALAVHIKPAPTHIAMLPEAVCLSCHALRRATEVI